MDNQDLITANQKYQEKAKLYDDKLKAERNAKLKLLQKEADVRLQYWSEVVEGKITKGVFDGFLKNDTFMEKVEYEKVHTEKMIVQNQLKACEENLNVIKKQISIR